MEDPCWPPPWMTQWFSVPNRRQECFSLFGWRPSSSGDNDESIAKDNCNNSNSNDNLLVVVVNPLEDIDSILVAGSVDSDITSTDCLDESKLDREAFVYVPLIPVNLLVSLIAPFIADRDTFNNFAIASKEVWEGCNLDEENEVFLPPWPSTLLNLRKRLWSVSFSPDERTLAIGATDGSIFLYDRRKGPLEPLREHLGRIYDIVFTADGRVMVSLSGDGEVRIWDMEERTMKKTVTTHTTHAVCLAFDANTMKLATGGEGDIKLYSIPQGIGLDVLTMERQRHLVESVAFRPDGQLIAMGTSGHCIHLWDMALRECICTFHESSSVHSIAFSPDGNLLASGTDASSIRVWNITTRDYFTLEGHRDLIWSVSFSSDGTTIASASDDGTVRLWSTETGRCIEIMDGHARHSVYGVGFSPCGKMVASTSDDGYVELRLRKSRI